jgi:hypothetical protein
MTALILIRGGGDLASGEEQAEGQEQGEGQRESTHHKPPVNQ